MEGLINIRRGASSDRLSVGGFGGGGLYHGGIEREDFRLVLRRSQDALAARNIFQTAAFFLYQGVYCKWSGGGMGRGSTASGGGWWWSLLLAEQRECYVELVTER